ncbi:MAG: nicotinate phosphoribosyltransferase [Gammaproteobacteria bacterium 39-13]|nr:nicotinate phosphoribosyltransferase [Gammaproteobacteria bacterium]OJV90291.1 MAG: nicotinate phosphoribosyltransferase [Gammaproteobacteria bacterium 39-13]
MQTPIINSLLDTDLYKFTMMQCVFHHYPKTEVAYRFKCRKPIDLSPYVKHIQEEAANLCALRLSEKELSYLASLPFFKGDFIDYLRNFQLNLQHIDITVEKNLDISIKGPWLETILFEVPILAIVSEVYYRDNFPNADLQEGRQRLHQKISFLKDNHYDKLHFSDFGTRRRFSKDWQQELLLSLKEMLPQQFVGTSNIHFSQALELHPIGTMAHEYLQAFQVLAPELESSQKFALNLWLQEYQGALGIALTDVLTMDIFLKEFDTDLATRYAGLRQDSGDPFAWGDKAIKHYKSLGIDPSTKAFIFSDSLTLPKAAKIYDYFKNKCQPYFGIGTNLTNDVGFESLDIVIKMTHVNSLPVIKISDSIGKIVCEDSNYLNHIKKVFHL